MLEKIQKDPIESTEQYQKIKDELENKINICLENSGYKKDVLGYCHIYWQCKKEILKKDYDIEWKSPEELNPDIIFD